MLPEVKAFFDKSVKFVVEASLVVERIVITQLHLVMGISGC